MLHARGRRGGQGKENQDTYLTMRLANDVAVYAVFDGHGKSHGKLASRIAANACKAYLALHEAELTAAPVRRSRRRRACTRMTR